MNKTEISSLTGLRFLAAFYVFIFHLQIRWPIVPPGFFGKLIGQGAVGMSIFFILSGFILAYRYSDGRTSVRDYFVNRLARIYPVYAAAAIVTLPWFGIPDAFGSVESIFKSLSLVMADIFVMQAWYKPFFNYWNNGASWSISVEVFCYALLPFLLPFLVNLQKRQITYVAITAYSLAALPVLVFHLLNSSWASFCYGVPLFRLPEFIVGACAAIAVQNQWIRSIGDRFLSYVFLFFVCYLGVVGGKLPHYVGHNWIVVPVVVLFICELYKNEGSYARALSRPISVWLGKISYCFYSFQPLVLLPIIHNHDAIVEHLPFLGNNWILALCAGTLLLAIAALAHYSIEEPCRRWIRKRLSEKDRLRSLQPAEAAR